MVSKTTKRVIAVIGLIFVIIFIIGLILFINAVSAEELSVQEFNWDDPFDRFSFFAWVFGLPGGSILFAIGVLDIVKKDTKQVCKCAGQPNCECSI